MGKASRNKRRREAANRIRVDDAARLMATARHVAAPGQTPHQENVWVGGALSEVLHQWDKEKVVLRADSELLNALLDTDRTTEVDPDWYTRSRFSAPAVALTEPMPLHDGVRTCTYHGFLVCGVQSRPHPTASATKLWTTYHPIAQGENVRAVWIFTDDDGTPGGQSLSIPAADAEDAATVEGLVDHLHWVYEAAQGAEGRELDTLVPLTVLLLLYMTSNEPDVEVLAPEQVKRPQQLTGAAISNLGWRVGAAVRRWRQDEAGPGTDMPGGRPGQPLPPHIRSAHWRRVRIAERDADGNVAGSVHGVQGQDWHYELRWIPPTPVNVGDDGPAPAVRDIDLDEEIRDT